jgi:hypothetical protein
MYKKAEASSSGLLVVDFSPRIRRRMLPGRRCAVQQSL